MNMKKDICIRVSYKNADMKEVCEKRYTLEEYTGMLRADLLRLITDIEDLVYEMNGNKPKREWSDTSWAAFQKVKHKMLDKAGEIGRLAENIQEEG